MWHIYITTFAMEHNNAFYLVLFFRYEYFVLLIQGGAREPSVFGIIRKSLVFAVKKIYW
jgi:hypothetical protein